MNQNGANKDDIQTTAKVLVNMLTKDEEVYLV